MKTNRRKNAPLLIGLTAALLLGSLVFESGWASASSKQAGIVTVASGGVFESVSCPSLGFCGAIGSSRDFGPSYASESNGVWSASTRITIAGPGALTSISCPSIGDCTAVGYDGYSQPVYETETDGTWGGVSEVPTFDGGKFTSISCTAVGSCLAVGDNYNAVPIFSLETAGVWQPIAAIEAGARVPLSSVSCGAASECTAVGFSSDIYAPPCKGSGCGGLLGDSNYEPLYTVDANGVWGPLTNQIVQTKYADNGFESVSCSDPTDCTATGGYDGDGQPFFTTETDGDWGQPTQLKISKPGLSLVVSCWDAGDCTAVGEEHNNDPYSIVEQSGAWTSPHLLTTVDSRLNSVSCVSAGNCTAVGSTVGTKSAEQPLYDVEVNGVWGTVPN